MIIETAKNDMLCFTIRLKDGAEPVELQEGQTLMFMCPVECTESEAIPDGRVMLEIEGISVTEPVEEGSNETPDTIPGLYAFIADLNNCAKDNEGDAVRTQVIPGRYPFEVRIYTTTINDNDEEVTYHQTIAFMQDNALIIHKGAMV